MTSIFVLAQAETIWGVFLDKTLLFSMYDNLKRSSRFKGLCVTEIRANTNLTVGEWIDDEAIVAQFGLTPTTSKKKEETTPAVPKALRAPWDRMVRMHSAFVEQLALFRKLAPFEKGVPELLRKYKDVYADIIRLEVPDDEAFAYFLDRTEIRD